MILHLLQILLTDDFTFILFAPECYAPTRQIVGRNLYLNPIPRQYPDKMHSDLSGYVGQNLMPVIQGHLEHGVGQRLLDDTFYFYEVFF